MVRINPITEDTKNLGNLRTFSQKSGIITICFINLFLQFSFQFNFLNKINFILNQHFEDANMIKYGLVAQSVRAGDS